MLVLVHLDPRVSVIEWREIVVNPAGRKRLHQMADGWAWYEPDEGSKKKVSSFFLKKTALSTQPLQSEAPMPLCPLETDQRDRNGR